MPRVISLQLKARRPLRPRTALLLATLLLCACAGEQEPTPTLSTNAPTTELVAARVSDHAITLEELQAEATRRGVASSTELRQVLDELIRRDVLLYRARVAGYERDPEVVAALERALLGKLRNEQLEPRLAAVEVSADEVAAYHTDHPLEFTTPARVRAAIIRISVPQRASEEKRVQLRQRAEQARGEALALPASTLSFGSVAVRYSDDQSSRYRGGDTGWTLLGRPRGNSRWPAQVLDSVAALDTPGAVSDLITTDAGHYLAKLIDRQASTTRPLAEVREQIRHRLLSEKKRVVEEAFYAEQRRGVTVEIGEEVLATIPLAAPAKLKRRPPALPE